ncbi:uncharacterized protein PHALS_15364 [Plasmopara halstedii]|uniref:Uncharacterized protein n=1 Tax=Plasmopara halstedii TaxID=4781 RepID=A0A0P1AF10_PLAHL|nr:uncharacterized protein PHALS_15364 [Plasmopara halstedii]CEG39185.1 hypothetical protein PHALS_15364 [Plasmopara halstedii]|eukprot:XP_024575554.1 hypothetical protein PHALS_15364 [Plasmopara halstedii]
MFLQINTLQSKDTTGIGNCYQGREKEPLPMTGTIAPLQCNHDHCYSRLYFASLSFLRPGRCHSSLQNGPNSKHRKKLWLLPLPLLQSP